MAAAFTVFLLAFARLLHRLLGDEGETLENALGYCSIVFAGAVTVSAAV